MQNFLKCVLILSATLLTACVGPAVSVKSADNAAPEDRVMRSRIEFVDSRYQPIPARIVKQPHQEGYEDFHKVLWLGLHAIPGRIAGIPEPSFFQIILKSEDAIGARLEPRTQESFALSLAELERMIAKHAATYRIRPEDDHFSVEPADTRFVRLTLTTSSGAFSYVNQHESGFIDNDSRDHYAMVYVDRPCTINGDIRPNDGLYRHHLVFDKPGIHWLHIKKSGDREATVTADNPAGSVLVYVRYDRFPAN